MTEWQGETNKNVPTTETLDRRITALDSEKKG